MSDTCEPLGPGDLPLVERVLDQHPEVREVICLVKRVAQRARFPIAGIDELAEALGGEGSSVLLGGRTMTAGEWRRRVPAYYFPIHSEEDLIAKVSDLRFRPGGELPVSEGVGAGMKMPLPEGLRLPPLPELPRPSRPGYVVIRPNE
jgi:hypothetical protein